MLEPVAVLESPSRGLAKPEMSRTETVSSVHRYHSKKVNSGRSSKSCRGSRRPPPDTEAGSWWRRLHGGLGLSRREWCGFDPAGMGIMHVGIRMGVDTALVLGPAVQKPAAGPPSIWVWHNALLELGCPTCPTSVGSAAGRRARGESPDHLTDETDYWFQVWAARTLLDVWNDACTADVVAAPGVIRLAGYARCAPRSRRSRRSPRPPTRRLGPGRR